ncbi:MAG: adenylate/guanylate cyclase domain-containing protein [Armatimonadetes bacterium]|nr:adenylate/guanylate cyclase domain-containing protein [Armatimonadota bacterium]
MRRRGGYWASFKWSFGIALGFSVPGVLVSAQARERFYITIPAFALGWALWISLGTYFVNPWLRRIPFLLSVVGTALLYVVMIVLSFTTSMVLMLWFGYGLPPWRKEVVKVFSDIANASIDLKAPMLGPTLATSVVLMAGVTFVLQISRMLGPGVLSKWLLGQYRNPRQERRVFMFIDMKDSTTLAEKLGDMTFSALVQRFLGDLTEPVLKTKGEVSHYIGDEAVVCWNMANGAAATRCIESFFLFQDTLESRRAEYERDFGLLPGFKAGAHVGTVVATQVGEIKTEIVYHGDVLNTAARIQGMCGDLGATLLVSKELAEQVQLPARLVASSVGNHRLKGKEAELELVRIDRAQAASAI